MKVVKCIIEINTQTGNYEMKFQNVSEPGEDVDYSLVSLLLKKVLESFDKKIKTGELKNKKKITKLLN